MVDQLHRCKIGNSINGCHGKQAFDNFEVFTVQLNDYSG